MYLLAVYFLKANIVLSVLFFFYWLLLRNEKFFAINRFILLSIVVTAFLLPLLPSNFSFKEQNSTISEIQEQVTKIPLLQTLVATDNGEASTERASDLNNISHINAELAYSLPLILLSLYLLIALVFFIRFALQLVQLCWLLKGNERKIEGGIVYHTTEKPLPPFSFFQHLVISKSQFASAQVEQIIAHEKVHIQQWHMFDILLAELVQVLLWINPFVWKLNRYIKLNLEYIADEQVLNTGVDRKDYQMNILTTCLNPVEYDLANLFNSKIKLRIKMMNERKSSFIRIYKYGFIIPLLFSTYLAINAVGAQTTDNQMVKGPRAIPDQYGNIYLVMKADLDKRQLRNIEEMLADRNIGFKVNKIVYTADNLVSFIDFEINVPGVIKERVVSGNNKDALQHPVIFFYESGKGTTFTDGQIPDSISHIGKLIIDDNLNGLMIIEANKTTKQTGFIKYYDNWKY